MTQLTEHTTNLPTDKHFFPLNKSDFFSSWSMHENNKTIDTERFIKAVPQQRVQAGPKSEAHVGRAQGQRRQ